MYVLCKIFTQWLNNDDENNNNNNNNNVYFLEYSIRDYVPKYSDVEI